MSYQKEREEFIARASQAGLPIRTLRRVLADANTIQRCAELACSDEWYCNVTQARCPECTDLDAYPLPEGKRARTCPAHRAEARLTAALPPGWTPDFAGDPRGYTVRLYAPGVIPDESSSSDYIGVPARGLPASFWNRR